MCLLVWYPFGMVCVQAVRSEPIAQWTLAVYLDSDNNLDFWAQKDVEEMMRVGSTADVNVLVFWDRQNGPANAYKVLSGSLRELKDFSLNGLEPNMGTPKTLRDWVSYTTSQFRSDKYALVCWDHGDDFRGCMYDEHIPQQGFDLLTHQEVVTALTGFHIDALVYAACVLQEIEVSYEYYAGGLDIDYLVANEGYDPMDGFPYDTILGNLISAPTQSPLGFSKMLVDRYIEYYEYSGKAYSQSVTLSVVELDNVGKVVSDLKSMTDSMMIDMKGYAAIASAASGRANLPWSESGWERLIDLPTFVRTIHELSLSVKAVAGINPEAVRNVISSSENLLSGLSDAVLYYRNTKAMDKKGCLGIGIYFPSSLGSYEHNKQLYGDLYPLLTFASQGWLDFLYAYWSC